MKRLVIALLLIPSVYTLPAMANSKPVAHVIVNSGSLQAINDSGTRELKRGDRILEGDTLQTGSYGYAQLRFYDGALVNVRPKTQLRIDEFNFSGREDGEEKSLMSLLRGGFRTITGLIGKTNKRNYQVRTPVATIGIRGTHYGVSFCDSECGEQEQGLFGGVIDGQIVVENELGSQLFNNDEFFYVADNQSAIRSLTTPPGFIFNAERPAQEGEEASAEDENKESQQAQKLPPEDDYKDSNGDKDDEALVAMESSQPPPTLAGTEPLPEDLSEQPKAGDELGSDELSNDFPAYRAEPETGVVMALAEASAAFALVDSGDTISAVYLADEELGLAYPAVYKLETTIDGLDRYYIVDGSTVKQDGQSTLKDGSNVYWGRWDGGYILHNGEIEQHLTGEQHYMFTDNATTQEQLGTITGASTYYSNGSDTPPTISDGDTATYVSIATTVDFTEQQISTYDVYVSTESGTVYDGSLTNVTSITEATSTGLELQGTSCVDCTGQASLLFVGDTADAAITSYYLEDSSTGTTVTGASLLEPDTAP